MALTDTFVKNVKPTGAVAGDKHADGLGLYLHVKEAGKYWRMNYRFTGKQKTLALGVYPEVSLSKARKRREIAREQLAEGIDPGVAKREERQAKADAAANTFEAVARVWLTKTAAKRAEVTQSRITTLLEKDVFPFIGGMPITAIKPRDVLDKSVRKIEARGSIDTAHRAKQICGQIFRYAVAIGMTERDITTDLRGALEAIPESHFSAITEPKQAGELLRSIFDYSGHPCTVAALKLSAMVFVRPGELRTAEWTEIDMDAAEWRIPGSKMKMGVDHLVPLSTQAVAILRSVQPLTGHGRYVFPSLRTGERPMSENTVNAALRGLGYSKEVHTAHGFRALARTIMDEVLGERVDLIEHQLAHAVKDPNGRAYNRTAHLPARREMMQRWSDYLDKLRVGAEVIPFKTVTV
ncbi:MAG: integrase arm-type DNA-binding domain-containing protein [Burkholderiales bacterium]